MKLEDKDGLSLESQMDYAMKHFGIIAGQRMQMFQFHLTLFAASIVATLALFGASPHPFTLMLAGAFHVMGSVAFFIVEQRCKQLLEVARQGLLAVEDNLAWPRTLKLAHHERIQCSRRYSFGKAFAFVQFFQFALGLYVFCFGAVAHHYRDGRRETAEATSQATTNNTTVPSTNTQVGAPLSKSSPSDGRSAEAASKVK